VDLDERGLWSWLRDSDLWKNNNKNKFFMPYVYLMSYHFCTLDEFSYTWSFPTLIISLCFCFTTPTTHASSTTLYKFRTLVCVLQHRGAPLPPVQSDVLSLRVIRPPVPDRRVFRGQLLAVIDCVGFLQFKHCKSVPRPSNTADKDPHDPGQDLRRVRSCRVGTRRHIPLPVHPTILKRTNTLDKRSPEKPGAQRLVHVLVCVWRQRTSNSSWIDP
jgi:hypothetical protein